MISTLRTGAGLLAALALVAFSSPASADDGANAAGAPLEQVVITASLDGATLATLPQAATVLDGQTLRDAGVQHFGDVLGLVPGLGAAGGTTRPRFFQIRGVGETEQYQGAPNPSVGFLIDDIDFSGVGMPATLFDLGSIEVLRGPSGTVYGANALAGLIDVRSRDPGRGFELRGEGSVGDYGTRALGLAVGDGRDDGSAGWRLAAQKFRSDGFRDNVYLGRRDTNGMDEATMRGKLHWAPGERLDFTLSLLHADINDGYDAWSLDNSFVVRSNQPGRDAQRSSGASLRAEWRLEHGTLRSVTSGADSRVDYSFDGDWGNDAYWGVNAPYDYFEQHLRNRRTLAEDLRYIGGPTAGGWRPVAGYYALSLREHDDQLDTWNDPFSGEGNSLLRSDYRALNQAIYGSLEHALGARGTLQLGLRGERRTADYADSADAAFPRAADNMGGGNLSWRWQRDERLSRYLTLARGYKGGGFNIGAQVDPARRHFDPESLWSLEAGQRGRSADGSFDYQLAAYYMKRERMQVYTSVQLDPSNPLTYVYFTDNASSGLNMGLEGELRWRPAPRWQLGGSGSLQRTRYQGAGDLAPQGRAQPYAPAWQAALGADWQHPAGPFARLDVQAQDGYYFSASHDQRAPSRLLVNLRAGWRQGAWTASAWVRNLLDRRYALHGFYFGDEPPDFNVKLYLQQGDPRQIGFTLSYEPGR
jgi:iron complex outermembrane recepter protein